MAKTKQTEKKNTNELRAQAEEIRKELRELSQQAAKGQLKQTTQLRTKKDELARILTKMSMMQFAKIETKEETK